MCSKNLRVNRTELSTRQLYISSLGGLHPKRQTSFRHDEARYLTTAGKEESVLINKGVHILADKTCSLYS
jgi:hypothetical protein